MADQNLAGGLDVVIDAVNSVEPARDQWRALARRHGATLVLIECVLADRAIHAARLAGRDRGLAIPEPGWEDVERRRSELTSWPEPHLTLDAREPIEANLGTALDYVARAAR